MVDVVNSVSGIQGSVLKTNVQNEAPVSASPAPQTTPQQAEADFISSSIHVDNLQNVAILEYRSSQTGEVIQQYPTQSQIEAFKRAEKVAMHVAAPLPSAENKAPATPAPAQVSAPAPQEAPAAPAPSSGSGGPTTSVEA